MEAKHTPGPWEVAHNNTHTGEIAVIYHTTHGVTEIWSPNWPDANTQDANARLIAKAWLLPEVEDFLRGIITRETYYPGDEEYREEARALLAKIEG